jgi:hypothetical protein
MIGQILDRQGGVVEGNPIIGIRCFINERTTAARDVEFINLEIDCSSVVLFLDLPAGPFSRRTSAFSVDAVWT